MSAAKQLRSAVYFGRVTHRRELPIVHEFTYRHFALRLDLDELERVFAGRWLWSLERANLASFRRSDYLGEAHTPLAQAVRERASNELGRRCTGRVELVTQPRLLGYVLNPVSFYFVYDEADELDAIVAEITNTPWNERHSYVLDARERERGEVVARFDKRFHISPFMDMEQSYVWGFADDEGQTRVRMETYERGAKMFEARMQLERRPLDGRSLAKALAAFPGFSLRTVAAIYWQALRLKLAGAPFFEHPKHRSVSTGVSA
ncbi:MAG: DUF1365 domain-containing protein [Planctomycetes bacterium]|nr:DUF1365 domain-containing protein [Planctomycetota bacterium]